LAVRDAWLPGQPAAAPLVCLGEIAVLNQRLRVRVSGEGGAWAGALSELLEDQDDILVVTRPDLRDPGFVRRVAGVLAKALVDAALGACEDLVQRPVETLLEA
jgi:hypothetical protein